MPNMAYNGHQATVAVAKSTAVGISQYHDAPITTTITAIIKSSDLKYPSNSFTLGFITFGFVSMIK